MRRGVGYREGRGSGWTDLKKFFREAKKGLDKRAEMW